MMLVDIEIAIGLEREIEATMLREQLQHVIEEADSGGDPVVSAVFDLELAGDLRLPGVTLHGGGSHRMSASSSWLMSSSTALACSSLNRAQSSSRRALVLDAMPMNGTPAALALRASSTVSPI